MNTFYKEVKKFLAAQNTSIDELAETFGCHSTYFYKWSDRKEAIRCSKHWQAFESFFKDTEGFDRVLKARQELIEEMQKKGRPTNGAPEKKTAAITAPGTTAKAKPIPQGFVDPQLLFQVYQAAKKKEYETIFLYRLGADWRVETLFRLDQDELESLVDAIKDSESLQIMDVVLFPKAAANGELAYENGVIIGLNGSVQVLTPTGMVKFDRTQVIKIGKKLDLSRLAFTDIHQPRKGGE